MDDNNKEQHENEEYRIQSGEMLVWRPNRPMTRRIPCVTVGAFRDGRPAVNFRLYSMKEPGLLVATGDGLAVSFAELATINERLKVIAGVLRDAA